MNEQEKAKIAALRLQGQGYRRIAKELGLSLNTVKAFCTRNTFERAAQENIHTCKNCGRPVVQLPGRKQKKFCSDQCRMAWWNSHQEQVKRKANYQLVCAGCGREFLAYGHKERKFCSRKCYLETRIGGGKHGSTRG